MRLLSKLLELSLYAIPENVEQRKEEIVRSINRKYSRGNVRLQMGKYSTKRDIDSQYEALRYVEF